MALAAFLIECVIEDRGEKQRQIALMTVKLNLLCAALWHCPKKGFQTFKCSVTSLDEPKTRSRVTLL